MNGKVPGQKVWVFHISEKNGKVGACFVHAVAFKLACLCMIVLCLANLKAAWLEEAITCLCLDRFFYELYRGENCGAAFLLCCVYFFVNYFI